MGAVLTMEVVLVIHRQITVHIVCGEGLFLIQIQLGGSQIADPLVDVEQRQNGGDLLDIQQIQPVHIAAVALACGCRILLQSVQERTVVQGLVVGVRTGVDDRHTAACAGEAVGPGQGGAGHGQRCVHLGLGNLFPVHHTGFIAVFQNHGLDALHLGDGVHMAVGDPGGNQVCGQGQIPDHIQLLTAQNLGGDGLGQVVLLGLQGVAVGQGLAVAGDIPGAEAGLDGGFVLQNDGDANHITGLVHGLVFLLHRAVGQIMPDRLIGFLPA